MHLLSITGIYGFGIFLSANILDACTCTFMRNVEKIYNYICLKQIKVFVLDNEYCKDKHLFVKQHLKS